MAGQLQLDVQSLQGKKTGEKYETVNTIVRKARNNEYTQSEVETFLTSCDYNDCPMTILYLSLVDFSRKSDIVVSLLKSEQDPLILRTIRLCTFFWADENYTADFYMTNIFPYLSYANRRHLVKALAMYLNNEERAQRFYEDTKRIYGVVTARPFLVHCGTDYILNLPKHKVVLTLKEIQILFKRNPDFVFDYIQDLFKFKKEGKRATLVDVLDHKALIHLIVTVYSYNSLKLIETNKNWLGIEGFGRGISKTILRADKAIILKDPKYYSSILKRCILYRSLSAHEYGTFYKGLFPKMLSEYDWSSKETAFSYLDYYKNKEDKIKLFLTTYASVYGQDFLSDHNNISSEILELLDVDQRVKFAQEKIAKSSGVDVYKWTSYLTCSEAIPKLKEQIHITPDTNQRKTYLKFMVDSCHINNDMAVMLEVLKYVNQRFRNDDLSVRMTFLSTIQEKINLDFFSDKHWEQIKEFTAVMIINDEFQQYDCYNLGKLLIAFVKYNLEHSLPINDCVLYYMRWARQWNSYNPWNLFEENPLYEKKCLLIFGELMPKLPLEQNEKALLPFLYSISSWNKRHPADSVSVVDFVWAIDRIKTVFSSNDDYDKKQMASQFEQDKRAEEYFASDLQTLGYTIQSDNFISTFKKRPDLILTQIKEICEECSRVFFIKQCMLPLINSRKINRVEELKEKLIYFSLQVMQNDDDENKNLKPAAMRLLSHWLPADEFYSIAKPYYPQEKLVDIHAENVAEMYSIQKSIAHGLKNYAASAETFDALKRFCVGDFLKLTVGSLNSVCVKVPLYKAVGFLKSCTDTPVSFKKHVIRLLCLICDKSFIVEFLKTLWKREQNPSIRQVLLERIYDNFTAQPSEGMWTFMKSSIEALSVKDKHGFEEILNFTDVPEQYLSAYVHVIWSTVVRLQVEDVDFKSYLSGILDGVIELLSLVSKEIVEELLQQQIFRPSIGNRFQSRLCDLAARYIFEGSSTQLQEERLDMVISELKTSFMEFWNTGENDDDGLLYVTRTSINCFIDTMCNLSVVDEKHKASSEFILSKLISKLDLVFDPSVFIYSSYITMHLALIFTKSADLVEFGCNIRPLIDKEIWAYSSYIIEIFSHILISFLNKIPQNNILEVANGLLTEPIQSVGCAYLAINIVKLVQIFKPENKNILDRLVKIDDKTINMMLNMYTNHWGEYMFEV